MYLKIKIDSMLQNSIHKTATFIIVKLDVSMLAC